MRIEFDSSSPEYHAPRDLYRDIIRQWKSPKEAAGACEEVLTYLVEEVEAALEGLIAQETAELGLDRDQLLEKGLGLLEEEARDRVREALERRTQPRWYFVLHEEGVSSVQNGPPVGPVLEVDGPRAFTKAELQREAEILNEQIARDRDAWTNFEKITAVYDRLRQNGLGASWRELSGVYLRLQQRLAFRNAFRLASQEARNAGRSLPELADRPGSSSGPRPDDPEHVDSRIPWAGKQETLFAVLDVLAENELINPEFVEDREAILRHFRVGGADIHAVTSAGTIDWRGTLYDIIAFFEWMMMNLFMNQTEARSSPDFIAAHFLRRGHPIKTKTIRAYKSGANNDKPMRKANGRINEVLDPIISYGLGKKVQDSANMRP